MTLETAVKCRGSQAMTDGNGHYAGGVTLRAHDKAVWQQLARPRCAGLQSPSYQSYWPASVAGDGLAFTASRFTAPAVCARDGDCRVPSHAEYKRRYMRSTARCINQARRTRNSRLALATE
jgi:hypothetical protein